MNKAVLLILTVIVTSMAGGCNFLSNAKKDFDESTSKPLPKVKSKPALVDAKPEAEEEFADLEEDTEPTQTIAGLIPTTDADTRIRSIVRGRQDPFSVVSLVPKIEIEREEEELPRSIDNRNNRNNRNNRDNRNNRQPNRLNRQPNALGDRLPTPIEQFKAELAQRVIISGLYESNGSTKLIVQAPEESNSRYVEVGQYLSNGQILVKGIDRNHFPTPAVILEQRGVEVIKTIGETPEDSRNRLSTLPLPSDNQPLISKISLNSEKTL